MTDREMVLYERGAGFGFRLPAGHEAIRQGNRITLEAPGRGGEYEVDRVELSSDGQEERIYLGPLNLGWWNAAPPGVEASYPFPTINEEIARLLRDWKR